ncbi:MAG TPA: hypothetical protein VMT89_04590 [Candidatus Acidoferrales bacterium]|nr:hypothetical protein [Candidatus Acidoferrales bacterium]
MKRSKLLAVCFTSTLVIPFVLSAALAEVSTDEPAAMLVFPKIIHDASQDTIVQISNATGTRIFARCFYINGAFDPDTEEPSWSITDFQLHLTKLQPTFWVGGTGLPVVPPDNRPTELYPGPVPPIGIGFEGELRCVVVNDSEVPISRNALTGEATIINTVTGSTTKYRAVGIRGLPGNNGDNTLLLNEVEYTRCPRVLLLNHFFDDAPDPVMSGQITSSLTFVPCSTDIEHGVPGTANLIFDVYNEFEQRLSGSMQVTCFTDVDLSSIDGLADRTRSIFNFAMQGTLVGQTRIRPSPDASTQAGHGVLAIAEEFRNNRSIGAAINLHFIGGALQSDVFEIPEPF